MRRNCIVLFISHPNNAHLSLEKCTLLGQEERTSFLGAYDTPANRLAQPSIPLLRSTESFVTQGSIFCCATKSAPPPKLRTSKSPSNESKKLCGLRGLCVSLNRCQVRRPRGVRPTNVILPLSNSNSKLELENSIHKSAHIATNQLVKICDDLWT